jgi:hypothetical protein
MAKCERCGAPKTIRDDMTEDDVLLDLLDGDPLPSLCEGCFDKECEEEMDEVWMENLDKIAEILRKGIH